MSVPNVVESVGVRAVEPVAQPKAVRPEPLACAIRECLTQRHDADRFVPGLAAIADSLKKRVVDLTQSEVEAQALCRSHCRVIVALKRAEAAQAKRPFRQVMFSLDGTLQRLKQVLAERVEHQRTDEAVQSYMGRFNGRAEPIQYRGEDTREWAKGRRKKGQGRQDRDPIDRIGRKLRVAEAMAEQGEGNTGKENG